MLSKLLLLVDLLVKEVYLVLVLLRAKVQHLEPASCVFEELLHFLTLQVPIRQQHRRLLIGKDGHSLAVRFRVFLLNVEQVLTSLDDLVDIRRREGGGCRFAVEGDLAGRDGLGRDHFVWRHLGNMVE